MARRHLQAERRRARLPRSIAGTAPAAGSEISQTVDTNARWKLRTWRHTFTTSGTGGTRLGGRLVIDDGTNILYQTPQLPTTTTTGATFVVLLVAGYGPNETAFDGINAMRLSAHVEQQLLAGWRIRTLGTTSISGDALSAPQFEVDEWIETKSLILLAVAAVVLFIVALAGTALILSQSQTVIGSSSTTIAEAAGRVNNPCTNSSTFIPLQDMTLNFTGGRQSVTLVFSGNFYAEQGAVYVILNVDGVLLPNTQRLMSQIGPDQQFNLGFVQALHFSGGQHYATVMWRIVAPHPNNRACSTQTGRTLIAVILSSG